jgi:hypothetical protein
VGSTRRLSAVRWGVAGRIVWAWVLTIPAAGLVAAATYWAVTAHRLLVVVAVAAVVIAVATFGRSLWRSPVGASSR